MTKEIVNLSETQVLDIPFLVEQGMTIPEIAAKYNVHERTINSWIFKLRAQGIDVKTKKGRPPLIKSKVNNENELNQPKTA